MNWDGFDIGDYPNYALHCTTTILTKARSFKANDGRNFAAVSTRLEKSVTWSRHTLGLF